MKTILTIHKIEEKFVFLKGYMEGFLLFDIETTGFSPATACIYLIGTARLTDPDQLTVTQYFAENAEDEEALLRAFLAEAASFRRLISFNGDAFDIPFIQKRAARYGLAFDTQDSVDLYKVSRAVSPVFPMKSRKLKAIEQFLGIFREDVYSGGDLIPVWKDYTLTKDPEKEKTLLLHNEEDVSDMFPVLSVLELQKLQNPAIRLERLVPEAGGACTFEGESGIITPSDFSLKTKTAVFRFSGKHLKGSVRAEEGTMRYFFGNPRAYRVLISEGKVIPASLAAALPKKSIRKARLSDCFAEDSGFFCPLPKGMELAGYRPYRESFESPDIYIKLNPENAAKEDLTAYLTLLLQGIMQQLI